jgi:hypothetical protein
MSSDGYIADQIELHFAKQECGRVDEGGEDGVIMEVSNFAGLFGVHTVLALGAYAIQWLQHRKERMQDISASKLTMRYKLNGQQANRPLPTPPPPSAVDSARTRSSMKESYSSGDSCAICTHTEPMLTIIRCLGYPDTQYNIPLQPHGAF